MVRAMPPRASTLNIIGGQAEKPFVNTKIGGKSRRDELEYPSPDRHSTCS